MLPSCFCEAHGGGKTARSARYPGRIVENRRCRGERIVQQTVLYLGEINDSQRAQWIRAIEVFDEDRGALEQSSSFSPTSARCPRPRPMGCGCA